MRLLPVGDREELEGHVQVFLAEKRFEGCDGLCGIEICVTLRLVRDFAKFVAVSTVIAATDVSTSRAQAPPAVSRWQVSRVARSRYHSDAECSAYCVNGQSESSLGTCTIIPI